jgi:hypothetical protein
MYPIEETPHHRAMLVTKSTELCRRHGLGTCPHSDADCRHIHKGKAGAFALKLTSKPPGARTPPSPQPTGSKPYPNHIAERHRAAIGPYTGTVSPTNPMRRSSPCREPSERILTHGPQVPLLTRAAPLRSDTIIRASSCCAVRRPPLLQCTVLHLLVGLTSF